MGNINLSTCHRRPSQRLLTIPEEGELRITGTQTRALLKWRGLDMAIERARRNRSSSKSLKEINVNLNRFQAEMAERKPQRGSSEKRLAALQHLERDVADLRGRMRWEAEHQKKMLKALEEEKKDIARKRGLILFWSRCTWSVLLSLILLSVVLLSTSYIYPN
ncbi:uncharacterized protein LOC119989521 isoform X2 [Tripterygium wilfordii]|uniref:uncharacterized protein LOC119989521 isoform X2 n=1 Tax=Tripterygium wilfordii TaxID=458696 RepID=UPI0018F85B03|nr:uncharacterized protein LOC119989521 isoform X2 [Tripterygium wilfordii]